MACAKQDCQIENPVPKKNSQELDSSRDQVGVGFGNFFVSD
jgi:hypothetical protein